MDHFAWCSSILNQNLSFVTEQDIESLVRSKFTVGCVKTGESFFWDKAWSLQLTLTLRIRCFFFEWSINFSQSCSRSPTIWGWSGFSLFIFLLIIVIYVTLFSRIGALTRSCGRCFTVSALLSCVGTIIVLNIRFFPRGAFFTSVSVFGYCDRFFTG